MLYTQQVGISELDGANGYIALAQLVAHYAEVTACTHVQCPHLLFEKRKLSLKMGTFVKESQLPFFPAKYGNEKNVQNVLEGNKVLWSSLPVLHGKEVEKLIFFF